MMDTVLNARKIEYSSRLEFLKERKKMLEVKKKDFEEKREKHLGHIQDLESMVEKSLSVVQEVEEQIVEKDRTIENMKIELKELQKQKESVQKKQKQCEVNQFLQEVIDQSNEEFKHPKDIITKFQSLNHILKEMNRKQITTQTLVLENKSKINHFVEEAKRAVFLLQSSIEELKKEEIQLEIFVQSKQNQLKTAVMEATNREMQLQQQKMSIFNMASVICRQMNKQLKTKDPIEQLTKIEYYLKDLNYIALELSEDV